MSLPSCLRATGPGCVLDVSVVPNARRTAADGWHDGALRVRLAAPPVDGKANAQLIAWLAEQLDCPRRDLSLLRGDTARRKQLAIALPAARVAAWLERINPPSAPGC
ncbi:MAG: DUF167 domain-containing protein [Burkholderiaceae bacterium]|nr:DUF167 domain-containing protein [Burkholderiaceae bacterium]